jgi:hypothetical protein
MEYLWVQIVLGGASSDVGVAIVYLVEGTEKWALTAGGLVGSGGVAGLYKEAHCDSWKQLRTTQVNDSSVIRLHGALPRDKSLQRIGGVWDGVL